MITINQRSTHIHALGHLYLPDLTTKISWTNAVRAVAPRWSCDTNEALQLYLSCISMQSAIRREWSGSQQVHSQDTLSGVGHVGGAVTHSATHDTSTPRLALRSRTASSSASSASSSASAAASASVGTDRLLRTSWSQPDAT